MRLTSRVSKRTQPLLARVLPAILATLLAGCDLPTGSSRLLVRAADVRVTGSLVRTLDVSLEYAAPVIVEYWSGDGPRLRVGANEMARTHALLLPRLRPDRTYNYEILGSLHGGTFTTEPLPGDLGAISFTTTGSPTSPLVLVHLFDPDGFKGYVILDRDGVVVWYWRTVDFPFGMTRRANGNFVFMDKGRGLVEVTAVGEVVHVLPQDMAQREQHHDVIASPQNTLLFIAFDTRDTESGPLKGEAIWEWSPETNTTTRRWSSWDFFSPVEDRGPRFSGEWLHGNALAVGPRGNILLSLHYLNQIVSIRPDWQDLEWRLGGVNATIAVPEDGRFSGQHTAREIAPGQVVLFDNRIEAGGPSRALEIHLTGAAGSVVWEWSSPTANFATAVSSARRLANGNTLIGFGMSTDLAGSTGPTEVYEVTQAGQVVWRLLTETTFMSFRAEPLLSIAGETAVGQQ